MPSNLNLIRKILLVPAHTLHLTQEKDQKKKFLFFLNHFLCSKGVCAGTSEIALIELKFSGILLFIISIGILDLRVNCQT